MTRPLRKDAALRRDALREAAAAEFAQNGLDVPLDAIADRAGVGRATLYRNFADRSELVLAVFSELVDSLGERMHMRGGPDAFIEFVDGLADLLLAHGGLAAALRDARLPHARLKLREKIIAAGIPALSLSKAAGRVRDDLSVNDIRIISVLLGAALESAAPEERAEMSRRTWDLPWDRYVETLKPHERPEMPGSPATPEHSRSMRAAYGITGTLVAVTGGLGNAMVSANIQSLAGELGITTTEAAWLPIVFVVTNACANLLLIKFRLQYGLRLFTEIILTVFVTTAVAHLFVNDFGSALAVRAVAGICGAGLSTLGFLYLLQAFPAAHRLKGLVIGIGLTSFTAPVARVIAPTCSISTDGAAFT